MGWIRNYQRPSRISRQVRKLESSTMRVPGLELWICTCTNQGFGWLGGVDRLSDGLCMPNSCFVRSMGRRHFLDRWRLTISGHVNFRAISMMYQYKYQLWFNWHIVIFLLSATTGLKSTRNPVFLTTETLYVCCLLLFFFNYKEDVHLRKTKTDDTSTTP